LNLLETLAAALVLSALGGATRGEVPDDGRISVLIVDGMNNHDWPRATRILKTILGQSGLFQVDVSTSPARDAAAADWQAWRPAFGEYDVVLSNFNGGHKADGVRWPTEVEKSLEAYVSGGGGLVIYHSANNAFLQWPAYNEMIGLGWRPREFGPTLVVGPNEEILRIPPGEGRGPGHGPEHDFQITTLDTGHPITAGMPKTWLHPMEQLSHGQHGPARNMTVLTSAHSRDTDENEVLDWVVPFGKGRVYTTMLGHLWRDKPDTSLRCVGFQTLLIRGTEWAATGRVTYPIPKNSPRADAASLSEGFDSLPVKVTPGKTEDRVDVSAQPDRVVLSVTCPSGIGGATVERTADHWPDHLAVRLHLGGLESLSVSNGTLQWTASVLSHSGNPRLLAVVEDGVEKAVDRASPFWTEIQVLDAEGKPQQGLPTAGGCFEVPLPAALWKDDPQAIELRWIDFYR
jgi:type 1 glutamine amidotransferase